MTITLVATCLAVLVASVLGGIVPLATVLNHTRLQVYLSFSAGTMLGAAFFHMLPEAVRVGSAATIPWAAAGLLALFFLERFFSFHHHESQERATRAHRASHNHHEPHEHSLHVHSDRVNCAVHRLGPAMHSRGHRRPLVWRFIRWSAAWPWPAPSLRISRSIVGSVQRELAYCWPLWCTSRPMR